MSLELIPLIDELTIGKAGRVSERPRISGDESQLLKHFDQSLMAPPRYRPATLDSPVFSEALEYLACWEHGFCEFQKFARAVHPLHDTEILDEYRDLAVGSSSASAGLPPGYMCVTVDNALGCAQALIREIAHLKLRLAGIEERCEDSQILAVREAQALPSLMNACAIVSANAALHDIYSLLHILQLDLKIARFEHEGRVADHLQQLMAKNVIRVYGGVTKVLPCLTAGNTEWRDLLSRLTSWANTLVDEAISALSTTPYHLYHLEYRAGRNQSGAASSTSSN